MTQNTPILMFDLAAADDRVRFSPYCWRIRMALLHKRLDFETQPWRFTDKDRIAFSGQPLVPVIKDRGHVLHDSWTIARYLEENYPEQPSLFGGDPASAQTLFLKFWTEQTLFPLILRIIVLDLFAALHPADQPGFRATRETRFGRTLEAHAAPAAEGIAALHAALNPLRATLGRQPFLGGTVPLFADYIVFGAFMWARAVSPIPLLEPDDAVHAWRERLLDLFDGHARQMPHADRGPA